MAKLWSLLTNELGQGFRTQFGDEQGESFRYWTQQLATYTEEQIFTAVERWVYSDEKFINVKILRTLCQPRDKDLGLPPIEDAFRIAMDRKWEKAHPALQCVLSERMYDIRRMSDQQARQTFQKIYMEIIRRVASGEKFVRPIAIEHNPSGTVHTKAECARGREDFKRLLVDLQRAG